MKEVLHRFGRAQHLCGIFASNDAADRDTAIVMISAGATHKAGPFRLGTYLAREMARQQLSCLRFDLGGQGESRYLKADGKTYDEHIAADLSDSLDFLTATYGFKRFIAVGLCTGADNAHKLAVRDPRICAVVCLDGYAYSTPRFRWIRLWRQLGKLPRLPGVLFKRLNSLFTRQDLNSLSAQDQYLWHLPPKAQFLADMQHLHDRGVRYAAVFSGGVPIYYNYAEQFLDGLQDHPSRTMVSSHYFELANHTYMLQKDRRALADWLCNWLRSCLNPATANEKAA